MASDALLHMLSKVERGLYVTERQRAYLIGAGYITRTGTLTAKGRSTLYPSIWDRIKSWIR